VKRSALSIAAILLLSTSAFSQLLVGPEVGVNYSWASFADKELKDRYKVNPVVGFHAGGHVAFKVRKRFFLHTSLLYSTKGRSLTGKFDELLKNESKYHYIEMPINYTVDFKGKIGESKEFKYFLGIGPNISYWLGGKGKLFNSEFEENHDDQLLYKIKFGEEGFDENNEMSVENPNRVQLGLNLIAGVVLEPWRNQRFMISVRYEAGHSYLAKSNGTFTGIYFQDPLRSRNQGFRASIAYLVDLKIEDRKKGKSTIDKRKMTKH